MLIPYLLVSALDRKTIFMDKMDGFEVYLERAMASQELKLDIIEEAEHPDLKVLLGNRFTSVYAELMYRKNTGRTEDTSLTLIDMKTKKEIVRYDFRMTDDAQTKQKVANEFVRRLKEKLK